MATSLIQNKSIVASASAKTTSLDIEEAATPNDPSRPLKIIKGCAESFNHRYRDTTNPLSFVEWGYA